MSAAVAITTAPERWLEKKHESEIRESLRGLWSCEVNGDRWVVATDGHTLIAELSDAEAALPPNGRPDISKYLADESGAYLGRYTIGELRTWSGEGEYLTNICDHCNGNGRREHSCDCGYCDAESEDCHNCQGRGADEPPLRKGGIGSMEFPVNLNKVAVALDALTIDEADVCVVVDSDGHHRISVRYPRGRFDVMGLRPLDSSETGRPLLLSKTGTP